MYMVFGEMRALQGFKIKLKEEFVKLLPSLIANSSTSLVDITFWERHRWLGNETWEKIQTLMGKVCHSNTRDVNVKLVDSHLGPFFSVMKINSSGKFHRKTNSDHKKIIPPAADDDPSRATVHEHEEEGPLEF